MFKINYPNYVIAGFDSLNSIQDIIAEVEAEKILIFTDPAIKETGLLDHLLKYVHKNCQIKIIDNLLPEPSYGDVSSVIASVGHYSPDLVVGLGGGSVMDAVKLFSLLKDADYTISDLLKDPLIGVKKIKSVMIPTTCGTGAEVTFNAIVAIPEENVKKGIVNPQMTADYVIIDPLTVKKLPSQILAATALDALCHGVECFTSNKANLMSDLYALECIKGIINYVRQAYSNPADLQARLSLQMAALYGGFAISSSGTHLVHALSYPLGGKFHVPHGVSNAVILYSVVKFNADVSGEKLARICDGINPDLYNATLESKINYVLTEIDDIMNKLQLPRKINFFGVGKEDIDFLVEAASEQQRLLVNNLKPVTKADIREIYLDILD